MNPRKPRSLIKKVAKDCNASEQLVSDLTHFFWIKVRKDLSSLDYVRVHVQNLGTFMVRTKQLEKSIEKTSKVLTYLNKESYSEYDQFDKLSTKVFKMEKLVETLKEEWKERSEHYEIKNANRESQDNLGEQDSDS